MLVRLVVVSFLLASCAGDREAADAAAVAQDDVAGTGCSTPVELPAADPVAEVRMIGFDETGGTFGATVEVRPLDGDLDLEDVPRPIRGRASDSPYGPSVAKPVPVAGLADAATLTATDDTPLLLEVAGAYPTDPESAVWLNASIASLGTFTCEMASG